MTGSAPRALVVACNFPPDASVGTMRTLRLVRNLIASEWHVDVVTIAPGGFRPGTVVDPALLDKVPHDVSIVRATPLRPFERLSGAVKRIGKPGTPQQRRHRPAPPGAPASASHTSGPSRMRRAVSAALTLPDREVSWLVPAVWNGWRHGRNARPDVVYSSGPPFTGHLAGLALARLFGVPWVADFRDPWARAPWREDRFEFERRAWSVLERMVVRRTRAAVFVTDANRRDFARQYKADASRFFVVPNGCDPGDFAGLTARTDRNGGRFVLLHAGSLYGARNPTALLRAIASACAKGHLDRATFRLRFIGRLGIDTDLPALARSLGLSEVVEFVNHVPRRESLQEMLDASALLVVQPITTVSIPAKLYEYMAAKRPILALAEPGGETAELITRSNAGLAVLADDEAAIEEALVSIVALSREGFTPVDPRTYDGDERSTELRTILAHAFAGTQPPLADARDSPVEGAGR